MTAVRRRRLPGIALLALIAAMSAGCEPQTDAAEDPTSSSPPASTSASPSPSPTVPPATPEEYQAALTAAATKVTRAFAGIAEARTYGALSRKVDRARAIVAAAVEPLEALVPPPDVERAHARLVGGLTGYAGRLSAMVRDVEALDLCAAPSVMAKLGSALSGDALRRATKDLRAAGYDVPRLAPPPRPLPDRSLGTGTYLVSGSRSGRGVLTIDNNREVDTVLTLTKGSREPFLTVYVEGKDDFVIRGIEDGSYTAYSTLGRDWAGGLRTFTRRCAFGEFSRPLTFDTVYGSTSIRYTTWTLTLGPNITGGGSVGIPPDRFPT